MISLDHERTERYSSNCMSRLGVPRGIRAGGPRLRASNRKTPWRPDSIPQSSGTNLQSPISFQTRLCRRRASCGPNPRSPNVLRETSRSRRRCENQRHVPSPAPRAPLGWPRLRPRNPRSGTYATRARRAHTRGAPCPTSSLSRRGNGVAPSRGPGGGQSSRRRCGLLGAPG